MRDSYDWVLYTVIIVVLVGGIAWILSLDADNEKLFRAHEKTIADLHHTKSERLRSCYLDGVARGQLMEVTILAQEHKIDLQLTPDDLKALDKTVPDFCSE